MDGIFENGSDCLLTIIVGNTFQTSTDIFKLFKYCLLTTIFFEQYFFYQPFL